VFQNTIGSGPVSAQPFLEDHADHLAAQTRRLRELREELQQVRDRLFGPSPAMQQGLEKLSEIPPSMTARLRSFTATIEDEITRCKELTAELGRF